MANFLIFERAQKNTSRIVNSDQLYHYAARASKTNHKSCIKNLHFSLINSSILIYISHDVEVNPGPLCSLEISHLNVRSLRNKIDIVETELNNNDILCLTETHLNPDIVDSDLIIDNYSSEFDRLDRRTGPGGGIIIYHKNNISVKRRPDLEHLNLEMLWIEIQINTHKLLLGCIYRPPDSLVNYWDDLDSILERAIDTGLDLVITGDLNINMLNLQPQSHVHRLLSKYNLSNLINEPTRITPTTSTSIDIIFTNNRNIIENISVSPPICSDHCIIHFSFNFQIFKQHSYHKKIFNYDNADYDKMNRSILNVDWDTHINTYNINDFNTLLCDTINNLIDECVPSKQITIRPNDKKWMNNKIRLK